MNNLRITTVQASLHWENIPANLAMFEEKLEGLAGKTDLVVLPEMFSTGFSMNAAPIAEDMNGSAVQWMRDQAAALRAVVSGSLMAREGEHFFNRFVWMRPDGTFETYDKRHLFTLAGEHRTYQAGQKKLVVEWSGWKICPFVCYDLRFPVWCRNVEACHLQLYVANWPQPRSHHWRSLLVARAIENQCYVAGVNRVGTDEKGHLYSGDTSLVDFSGKLRYQVAETEAVFTSALSMQALQSYREKLPFLDDRDDFEVLKVIRS